MAYFLLCCNGVLYFLLITEDEFHLIMNCQCYIADRILLFTKLSEVIVMFKDAPDEIKFNLIMASSDYDVAMLVGKFIAQIKKN